MELEILIKTETFDHDKFTAFLEDLKADGWQEKRVFGGKMPGYTGHGAILNKTI